ncbi:Copper transport protein [Aphelenchoides bicaudatus]|nr:Copper transport protein [Aphelenchoides bicaudatus]
MFLLSAHIMKMWFHGGSSETILFEWWKIETCWGLLFSCIAIILMGVLYEGIKWLRVYLHNVQLAKERQAATCPKLALSEIHSQVGEVLLNKADSAPDTGTLRSDEVYKSTVTRENNRAQQCRVERVLRRLDILNPSPCSLFRILQTFLYILQIMVAYWLMLIAMTYNSYLTAAVVLGCGLGHWIFAIANFVRFSNDTVASGAFAADVCH